MMQSTIGLDPKDDQPPPRPAGVHNAEEKLPTYSKMLATLLDQVNKALDEKKLADSERYDGMIVEIGEHLRKVTELQAELNKKLAELEAEESRKITSESIHTGFDSSYVAKSTPASSSSSSKPGTAKAPSSKPELLNPNFAGTTSLPAASSSSKPTGDDDNDEDDDDEITASPLAQEFAKIKSTSYRESLAFLTEHPQILTEKETDGILVLAFDAQLEDRSDYARNCVHQALLLQYCRALGRDGVGLFFKRITTAGHQAQEVFHKDVQDTYLRIKTRAREIVLQRAKDQAEGGGVEQIQLHAVEPGTVINIRVPPADAEGEEDRRGREIFDGFSAAMREALETGELEKVNQVLGEMKVDEAEEVVGLLGEVSTIPLSFFSSCWLGSGEADDLWSVSRPGSLVWRRRSSTRPPRRGRIGGSSSRRRVRRGRSRLRRRASRSGRTSRRRVWRASLLISRCEGRDEVCWECVCPVKCPMPAVLSCSGW